MDHCEWRALPISEERGNCQYKSEDRNREGMPVYGGTAPVRAEVQESRRHMTRRTQGKERTTVTMGSESWSDPGWRLLVGLEQESRPGEEA